MLKFGFMEVKLLLPKLPDALTQVTFFPSAAIFHIALYSKSFNEHMQ